MIPKTITATHVRQAAAEIKACGVPKGREADKFLVMVDGEGFPPKVILSIAARFATGTELSAAEFSGGDPANTFLEKKLNFKVVPIKSRDREVLLARYAFLPEVRGTVLSFLAESIRHAHSVAPSKWGVTPKKDKIRLNAGYCEMVTASDESMRVVVHRESLPKHLPRAIDLDPKKGEAYEKAPGSVVATIAVSDAANLMALLTLLRPAHNHIIEIAGRGPLSRTVRSGHSDQLVEEISEAVGQALPVPIKDSSPGDGPKVETAWDQALQRIKSNMRSQTYMPITVIAALELIQEGQATAVAIPFDKFEERFDALQESLGEGAVGMGWEPFLHLAAAAGIWTLVKDSNEILYHRESRPRSRAQLAKVADHASLVEELRAGVNDSALIPKLKALIGATSQKPTADPIILAAAAEALKGKQGSEPPPGNKHPKQTEGTSKSYVRDPAVVRWVLDRAKGVCELCTKAAPFSNAQGDPFLEVHHCIHLADGGPDTPENARGLCPNCHREIHLGMNRLDLRQRLTDL